MDTSQSICTWAPWHIEGYLRASEDSSGKGSTSHHVPPLPDDACIPLASPAWPPWLSTPITPPGISTVVTDIQRDEQPCLLGSLWWVALERQSEGGCGSTWRYDWDKETVAVPLGGIFQNRGTEASFFLPLGFLKTLIWVVPSWKSACVLDHPCSSWSGHKQWCDRIFQDNWG